MLIRIAAAVCLAAFLSACGGVSSPSQNAVQDFTGTVQPQGYGPVHTFSVSKTGEIFVTITALSPDQNIYLGVLVGQLASGACAPILGYQNNFAHLNAQALSGAINQGSYCIVLYDSSASGSPLAQPATYTLRVSHPS